KDVVGFGGRGTPSPSPSSLDIYTVSYSMRLGEWATGAAPLPLPRQLIYRIGYLYHFAGLKLPDNLHQRFFTVCPALIGQQELLAVGRNIFDDPLVAIIRQCDRIDLRVTVPLIEKGFFLVWGMPGPILTAANEHQVALFGRHDKRVPIDDVQRVVCANQDIGGVDVGVTQDIF